MSDQISVSGINEMFAKILAEESRLLQVADEQRDDYLNFALAMFQVLSENSSIKVGTENWIFPFFLTQVRKHIGLALLSVVRRHHIQAMLDLRQAIEAASWMLYAVVNTEQSAFFETDDRNAAKVTDGQKRRMYGWLDQNYSQGSKSLKQMKDHINESCAHASIVYAENNFNPADFSFSFFDQEHARQQNSNLFFIGTCTWQILDLLYGINQTHKKIIFSTDFLPLMRSLKPMMEKLRDEGIEEAKKLGHIV